MENKNNSWNYYDDEPIVEDSRYSKKLLKIAAPLIAAFCFYFLYSGRFDDFFFDKTLMLIPALMVLIVIPIMLFLTCKLWIQNENIKAVGMFLSFISILINGPFMGYWIGKVEEKAYRSFGVKTKAVVTHAWESDGSRMYYNFEVNGKIYTSFNVSNINDNNEGDTIMIIYNKYNPEMNEAL